MRLIFLLFYLSAAAGIAKGQELPEYNNSATTWNSRTNVSTPLAPEETVRKDKINSSYTVPYGSLFSKKAYMKTTMQLNGPKSKARATAEDTLRIFVKIDQNTDPKSIIKIYKAAVENNNREASVMQISKKGEVQRSDGDYTYDLKKILPGVFRVNVVGVKAGDEILFYIGTHEAALAKLTLGIE
jgi:hypothetical protein